MASKLCDSCKSATATLYCRSDSAFLCGACDSKVHAPNKVASRHSLRGLRTSTCKADDASLCITCDRHIHTANPLAARHERFPVAPFFESIRSHSVVKSNLINHNMNNRYDAEEEAEAASWLLPAPKADLNSFFVDLDYSSLEHKSDCVVPVQGNLEPFDCAYEDNMLSVTD